MKPKDRQREIVELVDHRGEASVDDLALAFDVSPETIRRDLAVLAEAGALQKVHGAARRMRFLGEGSFAERMMDHAGAKAEIARKLIAHIRPGETILMDTGTTTLAASAALASVPGLTVVTNSVRIAQAMGGAEVLLLGGRYRADNGQTVGPETIAQIAQFQADAAVLTVTAIDEAAGAMDADLEEAQIARAMRNHARRCIVLAHGAKFGKSAAHRICPLSEMDVLVCDVLPEPSFVAAVAEHGGTVC
ncbi:DeoR/GlpR family DNA-binding transcription regulator [Flavimaricola marinus]|uniref:Glycerol-3-phosphate regulon repressor n=1 Tax=Flavimaricola marinus TaxID=1819565 RepID=A0A238LIA4_9RHOB|nr:DeoR/GlpR family DNA-binding transcription regulator [Flavimaricola marinus]SMY08610.1 Glycerol-3-phosphate regulon repressor [Flavimaricola marinus]